MATLGFIGTGNIGRPMARHVVEAGHDVVVYDRRPEALEELLELGATAADGPRDVAERCRVVFTSLPAPPDVEAVVLRKMAGRDKDLSGYQVEVLNVNPATGAPVPDTQWNDAPFGGAILVRITGEYHPTLPTFLQTAATVPVRAAAMMGSEAN